ncbi:Fe-S cluster biogenesis protein NfuA, 4Fe-4S-binding domain [Zhouia amylolytica]|uniref:Fe-S cluster biogenesis protein NfuA, 4Fe-4S-binding domain n=1 Tax=Zhouia amylolytica TaxID=376730 RepID=A0A1I6VC88_9FLAO|nr:NifU family protein [Zhouia amylolytica]MCQ0110410.1 NifU family protein [Zhouia amylolytica]SFT11336.1 Fe-S cluster biogenesis protein NfuA, 4Fe-4S-binding domain [Zhouia amylolytica]
MSKVTIKIQPTNRPAIVKFEANVFLTKHKNYEFKNIDEAKDSPLAQQLFYLPFTKTVYVSGNFIAIERYDIVEWADVQNEVAEQIEAYLNSGQPVVIEDTENKKVPVSIYAENTPNPAVMKFVANKKLVLSPFEFKNIDDAKDAPLASALFHFPFVKEVFIDENYVSISKYDMADWNDIAQELREFIRMHIEEGKEIITEAYSIQSQKENKSASVASDITDLDDTSQQIVDILEEYVKPAVASDGGNIVFKSYDEQSKTVSVILQGACSGCPSSTITLKNGIETMLKNMMQDKVNEVVAING